MDRNGIKDQLIKDLYEKRIFWSWSEPERSMIPDEWLIEKVLIYSDLEMIYLLFDIYDEATIKSVWEKRLLYDNRLYSLNLLYALLFFHVKDPESYILEKTG